jgi:hypothetical protein
MTDNQQLRQGMKEIASIPEGSEVAQFGEELFVAHPDYPLQRITVYGLSDVFPTPNGESRTV